VNAVAFNGIATTNYVVNSSTQITVVVPTGATTGVIGVSTPGGVTASSGVFTVTGTAPTITGFSPGSGPVGGSVVISGTHFVAVNAVAFNGIATSNYIVNSLTQITVVVPTGATSGFIGVSTPGGVAVSTSVFSVAGTAPTITSFSPTSGPVGTIVVISGTNFVGVNAVAFNGLATTNYVVNSATQITVIVPIGATTGLIGVSTPGGIAVSSGVFTVTSSSPGPNTRFPAGTSGGQGGNLGMSAFSIGNWIPLGTSLSYNNDSSSSRVEPTSDELDTFFADDPLFVSDDVLADIH
jgi:hypothetical protein